MAVSDKTHECYKHMGPAGPGPRGPGPARAMLLAPAMCDVDGCTSDECLKLRNDTEFDLKQFQLYELYDNFIIIHSNS